ncbi:hypothetical protein SLEP1_g29453 [Rubroshorea leprosula]|uniref:non-specific serine/threonine protein kinase n=1 Tax=Rubroshorea leprosula TaxID=152421 RepID=A0AAV5JWZ6_9ROSI|nr:hypothetical protein SLEP1_g29453 [Rubroshorea leprosula]
MLSFFWNPDKRKQRHWNGERVRNRKIEMKITKKIFGSSANNIAPSKSIKYPEAIISNGSKFQLGFFSPASSTDLYVGIWYNGIDPVKGVIWVANREKPLKDSSGTMMISEDGNLVVVNGQEEVLWSSDVEKLTGNNTIAELQDSGNLVLLDKTTGVNMWESFQQPSNVYMPTMKLGVDLRSGEKVQLTSWKSPSDPSVGNFSSGIEPFDIPQSFVWKNSQPYWRSGQWNGRVFVGQPNMKSTYLNGFRLEADKQKGIFYLFFVLGDAWKEKSEEMLFDRRRTTTTEVKLQELPLLKFEELATATKNFSLANQLGQGGFGPVYKGTLQNGQEVAVKRLSSASGQGLEEFMNEVFVISKLQHRNLVRLLGCCVEREEKILVYEFMPNKSLDTYLFDPFRKEFLDWRKRFNVIEGISRGLLYLHRDSRLWIIHRDLKASNILLDEELNPKISDFGMARIFRGNEDEANTRRVVGTYGYMSPEYAMVGLFSEKSDVYSYGVLLLEIVSGRRNTSFGNDEDTSSLLEYAWKLWNEDTVLAMVDKLVCNPCHCREILRCIHVGLLCVQEMAKDRPTMSTVISMLNSEIVDLPSPKQPAFILKQIATDAESPSQHGQQRCSVNNVTVTIVQGR